MNMIVRRIICGHETGDLVAEEIGLAPLAVRYRYQGTHLSFLQTHVVPSQ